MTAFLSDAFRLLGHAAAGILCLMAMAPLASRRVRGVIERTLLLLFTLAAVWHALETASLFFEVAITTRPSASHIPVAAGSGVCIAGAVAMLAAARSRLRWITAMAAAAQLCAWGVAGAGSATFAWASAISPAIFYHAVRRHHLLGLTVGRRFIFTVIDVSSFYLNPTTIDDKIL